MPTVVYSNCECCSSSSSSSSSKSSSSSSSGGPCCNAPSTLHCDLTVLAGCACLVPTTITLTFNGATQSWHGGGMTGCSPGPDISLELKCNATTGAWSLQITGCASAGLPTFGQVSCSPLQVVFEYLGADPYTCCGPAGDSGSAITFTVTA